MCLSLLLLTLAASQSGSLELQETFTDHSSIVEAVRFARDEPIFASCALDGSVVVRRLGQKTPIQHFRVGGGHEAIDISPDGKIIAVGSNQRFLNVYQVEQKLVPLARIQTPRFVSGVALSPTEKVVAGISDGKAFLWNRETGELVRTMGSAASSSLSYTAAGQFLIACAGKSVEVWNPLSGQLVHSITTGGRPTCAVASPDGSAILVGLENGKIEAWDSKSWKLAYELAGHEGPVYSLAMPSAGLFLASGGKDKTLRYWDLKKKSAAVVTDKDAPILSVSFSPDGKSIVTAGGAYEEDEEGDGYPVGSSVKLYKVAN